MPLPLLRKYRIRDADGCDVLSPEIIKWNNECSEKGWIECRYMRDHLDSDPMKKEWLQDSNALPIEGRDKWYRVEFENFKDFVIYFCYNEHIVFSNPEDEMIFKLTWR